MNNTVQQTYCTLNAVSIWRSDKELLRDVSLTLRSGECVLVRGANGCGKSTLLRYIAGLDGFNQVRTTTQNLGYIGHTLALKESMTCEEVVDLYRENSSNDLKKVLPVFGCHAFRYTKVKHCSAGQKQRIALTRLLVEKQDVWLLDEPTTALDQEGIETFIRVVQQCRQQGAAFVIATHADLHIPEASRLNLDGYACLKETDLNHVFL